MPLLLTATCLVLLSLLPTHVERDGFAARASIDEHGLQYDIYVPLSVMIRLMATPTKEVGVVTTDELTHICTTSRHYLQHFNPLQIDGHTVEPNKSSCKDIRINPSPSPDRIQVDETNLHIQYFYAWNHIPQNICFVWNVWPVIHAPAPTQLGYEEQLLTTQNLLLTTPWKPQQLYFTTDEPSSTWHKPLTPSTLERLQTQAWEPTLSTIPLWFFLSAASLSTALLFFCRKQSTRIAATCGTTAMLALTIGAPYHIPHFWNSPPAPTQIEQEQQITNLLATMYHAFDKHDEHSIYDTLAYAVDGPLLNSLYCDLYTELINDEADGALSTITNISIFDIATDEQATALQYTLTANWSITGSVIHWGHSHEREKYYTGTFTVQRFHDRWKIIEAHLQKHTRVR